jgi:hypothetical protein
MTVWVSINSVDGIWAQGDGHFERLDSGVIAPVHDDCEKAREFVM